jgi:alpha-L-arabinofuranosidase B-like protein
MKALVLAGFALTVAVGAAKAETIADVYLTNAVFPPASPAGYIIGDLSASTVEGLPFQGTFVVQSGGTSPSGNCTTANGSYYQIVNTSPGSAHLEVLSPNIRPGPWPASNSYGYQYSGYFCVKAVPVSGTPFIRSFLLLAQGKKITAVTPTTVSYTAGIAPGSMLADFSAVASIGTASPSWSLDADCAGRDLVMLPDGELDVGSAPLSGDLRCHVVATQAGIANSPIRWPIRVHPGAYAGPADVGGALAAYSLNAVSAAAAENSVPAARIFRDNDHQMMDISVLPSGDLDIATAARFCAPTICGGWIWYDQTGGGNDLSSWGRSRSLNLGALHDPLLVFNAFEANPNTWGPAASGSLPAWSPSNGNDRLWVNTHFTKSAPSATFAAVAIPFTYDGLIVNSNYANLNSIGASLAFATSNAVSLGVGKISSLTTLQTPNVPGLWHVMQGVVNGGSSSVYIDGIAATTGVLPSVTIANSLDVGGDFGGGGMNGYFSEVLVLPPETADQASALCSTMWVPWPCN